MRDTIARFALLLAEGFEEGESLFYVDVLRRCGIACETVSDEGAVVVDGHLITSRGPATVLPWAFACADALGADVEPIKKGILYSLAAG